MKVKVLKVPMKAVSPFLLLATALLFLALGIVTLADSRITLKLIQYFCAGMLVVSGISRASACWNRKPVWAILVLLGFLLAAGSLFWFIRFFAVSIEKIFGTWFLLQGFLSLLIFIQCWVQKIPGRVRNGMAALISLGFGIVLWVSPMSLLAITRVAGIYMILYSVMLLGDFFTELLEWDLVAVRLKRRIRIALPTFMTAFIPVRLINYFNQYFKENPEGGEGLSRVEADDQECADLEVFIHLAEGGFNSFGHVDICYQDTVYSYGCYDHHAHRYFGMVSDGTMAVAPREPYIAHCLTFEKKVLVGFGLRLSQVQKQSVERQLEKVKALWVPWRCDEEKARAGELPAGEYNDAASELLKATGAKIYKINTKPFKTYFAINTNCVQLADFIIGSSGIDVLSANGIVTPGSYYSLLQELFERKNSLVVRKLVYKGGDSESGPG